MPKQWQQHAIAPVRLHDGTERILAADRIAVFNSEQGLGFDLAYRPGSLKEMLRQMASGNPDETYQPEPMRPEYLDREARLKLMEVQGVERAVVFPSAMALSVENHVKNVPAVYANIHAVASLSSTCWWRSSARPGCRTLSSTWTRGGALPDPTSIWPVRRAAS